MNFVLKLLLSIFALLLILIGLGGVAEFDGGVYILLVPVVFAVALWSYVIYKRKGLPPV